MENIKNIFKEIINGGQLVSCTFSGPRNKGEGPKSVIIENINDKKCYQLENRFIKHNDIKKIVNDDLLKNIFDNYLVQYKQCFVKTSEEEFQVLINKKLNAKIVYNKKKTDITKSKKHNRDKNYLIPDGQVCDFLVEIGIMDVKGNVKSNYYKKFRQINRFLELVDDLFKKEDNDEFHVVDFGCGKSYLTFALYYYFTKIRGKKVQITGIDLKQDVISHCNQISEKLGYQSLQFVHGFIHDFKTDLPIDFVVTLHACDTATDDAILFSLENNANKMMFVPCCQHELNSQIQNNHSNIMLKHGIFKDRMTSLVTDTMRTQLLEAAGYKVQTMEFIDLEHTAKNILLRCSKTHRTEVQTDKIIEEYYNFKNQWGINPYLEKCLKERELITFKEIL